MAAVLRLDIDADRGAGEKLEATRRFYEEVFGARELASPDGALWFLIGGVLVETGGESAPSDPLEVSVTDPEAVAARCWNAGYTVLVDGDDRDTSPASFSVIDPCGLRLDLATHMDR